MSSPAQPQLSANPLRWGGGGCVRLRSFDCALASTPSNQFSGKQSWSSQDLERPNSISSSSIRSGSRSIRR